MQEQVSVTVGVDTHADVHVAAVLDPTGRLVATKAFAAATRGYVQLARSAESTAAPLHLVAGERWW